LRYGHKTVQHPCQQVQPSATSYQLSAFSYQQTGQRSTALTSVRLTAESRLPTRRNARSIYGFVLLRRPLPLWRGKGQGLGVWSPTAGFRRLHRQFLAVNLRVFPGGCDPSGHEPPVSGGWKRCNARGRGVPRAAPCSVQRRMNRSHDPIRPKKNQMKRSPCRVRSARDHGKQFTYGHSRKYQTG